jgi:FkbM family methyltransferase
MSRLSRKIKNFFSSNPRSSHNADSVDAHEAEFYRGYLREGMTVFDVGSNVGDLAVLFSRSVGDRGRVHCFEPGETAFAKLSAVVGALPNHNVTLNQKAVGELVGKTQFHVYPDTHHSWNSRASRPLADYGIQLAAPKVLDVECTTVDDYCASAKIETIDLLKVDVEGAELQVFYGCRRMMRERRIRCCTFEFGQTTFDMGNQPAQLAAFFGEVNYNLRNLIPGDPLFPGGKSVRTAQFAMLLATPNAS